MIYCKIKERHDDRAVYHVGAVTNDMTGEITFFKDKREPQLNKQPEKHNVREKYIALLYMKYIDDFENGVFNDKIAYEIG